MNNVRILQPDETNNRSSPTVYLPPQPAALTPSALSEESQLEGGLEVGRILEVIQRRAAVILGVTTIILGLAVVWNRTRPPAYEGNFRILIEPVTAESQVVSDLQGNQTSVADKDVGNTQASKATLDYPTQIQLLLSPKLLLPVVQKLESSYPQLSYDSLSQALTISRLKEPAETKILDVLYKSASPNEARQVINLVSQTYIRYSLSERQTNVRRAVQFVDSQLPKVQAQVRDLELALQNFREKNQLIDPSTLGTQIGTQISSTQQQQLETQVELAKTKQLYRALEQQLQLQPKGAEAASVLSEAPEYQQLVKQLQDIDVELQTQSADLAADHPKVVSLREKREKLLPLLQQKANAALGSSLSRSITNVQSLPYQNALRQDLSKQFVASAIQVQVLEAKLNGLNLARQALARQSGQLPAISRQYENLQRRLQIATEQLGKFLQKREELMINAARQEVPWELIASPSIKKVSSSSLLRDLILGSILGVLVGIGVALLLEKMKDVIYTIKDLRGELKIPILGMIPKQEDMQKLLYDSKLATDENNDFLLTEEEKNVRQRVRYRFSPFIESFRALNSQIRLLRPDSPIQSLVVSSSSPNEGKTTVATQLAQAAAAMGQRVLLVDADLRRPSLQHLLSEQQNQGLTDVILGNSLMDTVQLMDGEENLYVLPAGSIALDPTSLLSSKKMRDLIENCQNNFDLVIYDTVPLNFADSLLLIPQTDGLLMVTRLGKIHREVLHDALRTLEVSKVPVLGLVANMVSDSSQSSANSYYFQQVVHA